MSFLKKIASRTRYAGTEGERDAYELISREFENLGCEVEKEETEYIKSESYLAMLSLVTPWVLLIFIVASWLIHPLTVALLFIAFLAFITKILPSLTLRLARDKSINVIATMNSEGKNRLILCGHYDSSRVISKFAQRHHKTLTNIVPFFLLALFTYVVILFLRGIYLLAVDSFNYISLLELSPRMVGIWSIVWWIYVTMFGSGILVLTYSWIPYFLHAKFSYGADDNASGIAVMIETARRLQDKKLNMRVDFACFAAEERGLFGSRKWVNKHLKELDKDRTYVFNVDCVGRGEKFFVYKGLGTIFKKYSDPILYDIVVKVCTELKFPLEEDWSGQSDHAQFVEKKFRTCAISRFNPVKANIAQMILRKMFRVPIKKNVIPFTDWIHTENDTVDGVNERKLEESVQLVVKFVEALNQKVGLVTL